MRKYPVFVFLGLSLTLLSSATLADIYSADVSVVHNGQAENQTFQFGSLQQALDTFSDDFLQQHFSDYEDYDVASGTLNLRGLQAHFHYDDVPGENHFILDIPDAGVSHEFTGDSRNVIDQEVQQWFKESGGSALTKIYQAMVSQTATDPVAGNPNSLMADMIGSAFSMGDGIAPGASKAVNLFHFRGQYRHELYKGDTVRSYHLPFGYTRVFAKGKYTLMLDGAVQYYQYDSAHSYSAQVDVGLARKINARWSVMPVVSLAGLGSPDMGSVSLAWSGFVKSQVRLPVRRFFLVIKNMGGYMQTQDVKIGDIDTNYKLHNWVMDNGLGLEYPVGNVQFTLAYDHTSLLGSHWYYSDYDRVQIGVGRLSELLGNQFTSLSLDASVTFAHPNFRSYAVGLSYRF